MKRNIIRIFSLALALILAVPTTALAAETQHGVLTYEEVIAPQYENAGSFSEGLAPVKQNGKWGYIDTEGNVVIPFQYEMAYIFREGLAVVAANPQTHTSGEGEYAYTYTEVEWGFINTSGQYTPFMAREWDYETDTQVTRPLVRDAEFMPTSPQEKFFHNGVVVLGFGFGDEAFYTAKGSALPLDGCYPGNGTMNEGLAPVFGFDTEGSGWVDASGKTVKFFGEDTREYFGPVIENEWGGTSQSYRYISSVLPFNQGLAPVWQCTYDAETWEETFLLGFMNRSFQWVIQPQFTNYFYSGVNAAYQLFGDTGLAMVQKDGGKYGAVDKSGKTVIPFEYDELWPVNDGLILFQSNGKYGYMDAATLQTVIPAQYQKATGFNNGLAVAYDGSKAFLINKSGAAVPGADRLDPGTYFKEDADGGQTVWTPGEYVVIQNNGKYGFGHIEYLPELPAASEMDSWAYPEVVAAIEENLVPVYLQNLYLNNITRQEFCDLVIQAIEEVLDKEIKDLVKERTGKDMSTLLQAYPFKDSTSSSVIAANALEIVNGRGEGIFDPYATITRQEAATLLMRAAKVLGMDTGSAAAVSFGDSDQLEVWSRDAVNFVYQLKVMNGTGENRFSPTGSYTREQSYMTVYRLFKAVTGQ